MKRGGRLPRHKGLQPGQPPQRRTRIKPRSDKMRAVYEVRAELVVQILTSRPWCEIRWDDDCWRRSTDVHEPGSRARNQVDITDEAECVSTCRHCHDQVHDNPKEAERRGWLKPSAPVDKPWEREAAS